MCPYGCCKVSTLHGSLTSKESKQPPPMPTDYSRKKNHIQFYPLTDLGKEVSLLDFTTAYNICSLSLVGMHI